MPNVEVFNREDEPVALRSFTGKVVVLNLWATWCAPCREEMPSLGTLQARYDKSQVEVVALAADRAGWDRIDAFMAEVGVDNLTLLRDPSNEVAISLAIRGLPATLVTDKRGRKVDLHLGFRDWASDDSIALIEQARTPSTVDT
ncbi:MAG: TlpA disulfide reductase family protein [Geminicoccaceae bacterium]